MEKLITICIISFLIIEQAQGESDACSSSPPTNEKRNWQSVRIHESMSSQSGNWYLQLEPDLRSSDAPYIFLCVDHFFIDIFNLNTRDKFGLIVPNLFLEQNQFRLIAQCMKYNYKITPVKRGLTPEESKKDEQWFRAKGNRISVNTEACTKEGSEINPDECSAPITDEHIFQWHESIRFHKEESTKDEDNFFLSVTANNLTEITAMRNCAINYLLELTDSETDGRQITIVDKMMWSQYQVHFEHLKKDHKYILTIDALKAGENEYFNQTWGRYWFPKLTFSVEFDNQTINVGTTARSNGPIKIMSHALLIGFLLMKILN